MSCQQPSTDYFLNTKKWQMHFKNKEQIQINFLNALDVICASFFKKLA